MNSSREYVQEEFLEKIVVKKMSFIFNTFPNTPIFLFSSPKTVHVELKYYYYLLVMP